MGHFTRNNVCSIRNHVRTTQNCTIAVVLDSLQNYAAQWVLHDWFLHAILYNLELRILVLFSVSVKMLSIQKYFYFCTFISFLVFHPSDQKELNCGIKLDDITKAISPSDSPSKFAPWVVSIGLGEDIEKEYEPHCTGTIIGGGYL